MAPTIRRANFSINAAYTRIKHAAINNGNSGIRNFGFGGRIAVLKGWAVALYTNTRNTVTGATIDAIEVGGTYPVIPLAKIALANEYMKGNDVLEKQKGQHANLTLDYTFSKRSGAYIRAAYPHASDDGNTATAWIMDAAGAASAGTQTILRLGLQHFF